MFGNSYLPLLVFVASLGILLPIAICFRRYEVQARHFSKLLIGLAAVITAGFLVTACAYAITPSFFDHFEPSIALGAERVLNGEQAFSDPNGAAQYASIYGPNAYLINALSVAIWPEIIAGSKLAGAVAALGFCGFFIVLCTRKNGIGVACLQIAVVLGPCLFFEQYSYWNRPEPIQLFGVALAISALTCRSRWARALALGISVALLVNLKVHSLLYVAPVIAEMAFARQWRVLGVAGGIACMGIIAPFLFVDLFSLSNYLASLRSATKHSWSMEMFAGNICALLFFVFPAAALIYREKKSNESTSIPNELSPAYLVTLAVVSLLACIIGSKLGAGPQHLIPLLPHFAWAMAGSLRTFLRAATFRSTIAGATCAWIAAMFVCAGLSQGKVWRHIQYDPGRIAIDDLHAIRTAFPESKIQMGCGSPFWWFMYWYRPELHSRDPVDFIDITAWMDMKHAGRAFSERTLDAFRREEFDIWLIPRACEPFTQVSYYPPFDDLFSSEFRETFASGYRLAGRSRCYDIYLARRLASLPVRH